MNRSLLTGFAFACPLPVFGTSVQCSRTFSKTILQCLSKALTRPNNFLLLRTLMSTCVWCFTLSFKTERGPFSKASFSSRSLLSCLFPPLVFLFSFLGPTLGFPVFFSFFASSFPTFVPVFVFFLLLLFAFSFSRVSSPVLVSFSFSLVVPFFLLSVPCVFFPARAVAETPASLTAPGVSFRRPRSPSPYPL